MKNNKSFMQKTLKPNNFMNEMHENKFKSFSKTFVFNPELQKQDFFFSLFTLKFSTNEHILYQNHRIYNLGWPNQIHTQFHVLSLAKNNL